MKEEKLIITQEMVDSFADMIKSKDSKDVKFAVDILELRDVDNIESEKHFNELAKLIISDDKLFPTSNEWIIKIGNKRLELKNNRSSWGTKEAAERALSAHLTAYLGKSVKNITFSGYYNRNIHEQARWKSTSPQDLQDKINEFKNDPNNKGVMKYPGWMYSFARPNGKEYDYDPQFDEKKFLQKEKEKLAKNVGHMASWGGKDTSYFKAMKMVFGGGKELRDFLIKNKIVEIIQL